MRVASPKGYELPASIQESVKRCATAGGKLELTTSPAAAAKGADAIYTDVWTSMGQEANAAARYDTFAPYQVNASLMSKAASGAIFMHCLPAHRGDEVSDEVIDSKASVVSSCGTSPMAERAAR